jgi:hypothetical protein
VGDPPHRTHTNLYINPSKGTLGNPLGNVFNPRSVFVLEGGIFQVAIGAYAQTLLGDSGPCYWRTTQSRRAASPRQLLKRQKCNKCSLNTAWWFWCIIKLKLFCFNILCVVESNISVLEHRFFFWENPLVEWHFPLSYVSISDPFFMFTLHQNHLHRWSAGWMLDLILKIWFC